MRTIKQLWQRFGTVTVIVLIISLGAINVLAATYDVTLLDTSVSVNGAIFIHYNSSSSSGTGVIDSFLRIQNSPTERGYNTDGTKEFDTKGGAFTHSIKLSSIPQVSTDSGTYREFLLDLDESPTQISLNELQLFTATDPALTGYTDTPSPSIGSGTTLVYDLDSDEDNTVEMDHLSTGSGKADYIVYIPDSVFGAGSECDFGADPAGCPLYIYLYNEFGTPNSSDAGFEEWAVKENDGSATSLTNPHLTLEKSTNSEDADDPYGPNIDIDKTVTWEYVVTNDGNVTLYNLVVNDDIEGEICTIANLAPGDSYTCTTTGIAVLGEYENIGSVSGEYASITVSDSDPSHYQGIDPTAVNVSELKLSIGDTNPETTIIQAISIDWETAFENNTLGFNIYRSSASEPEMQKINEERIESKVQLGSGGASYHYLDRDIQPATTYTYYLVEVTTGGAESIVSQETITPYYVYLPTLIK